MVIRDACVESRRVAERRGRGVSNHEGFLINLEDADKAARKDLPAVADFHWEITQVLTCEFEGNAPSAPDDLRAAVARYNEYIHELGYRSRDAYRAIEATAVSLQEIVDLYRRADGQA